ncbi:RNA polymerase sigma-70 factor [Echinicola strongylocentroti]|uniref:RNA polymerase sigma-70 factor n=1 Tax=Echinicola strongylocentroti TaxID=1795355 RepID=A0A2Z4IGQ2_9BACT|nr:RNA polymerase sigma-70 factor [Echinicola strongylocentroti]AWW29658.1 RNA polymerase sigma-70 factor [Echinicola strongylocentroti]
MSIEDADLQTELRLGDSKAFNKIYSLYWQKLYSHAYKRVGSPELTEDMVQEVFFQFWLKRKSLTITKSIESYLIGMLKNNILMYFREIYTTNQNHKEIFFHSPDQDTETERRIEYSDLLNHVDELIERLPEQSKHVFKLSRKEFLSNKEIADRLEISIKTVEYHIHYSLTYLRNNCPDYILAIPFSTFIFY